MDELTTNDKGAIAEAEIAAAATKLGFVVLKPMSERRRYDLVIDTGPRLWRVQCKWAPLKGDVIVARARTSRYTPTGYVRTTYDRAEIDALGLYCPNLDECFLLPIDDLEVGQGQTHLRLRPARNGQQIGVKLAARYELGAVAQLARASAWHAEGQGFESPQLHDLNGGYERVLQVDDLRTALGAYLQRTRHGESFVVTRRGHAMARLVPPPTPQIDSRP